MEKTRRRHLLALFTGVLATASLLASRRGIPGADRLAARLAKPVLPEVPVKTYGYKEVNLS